MPSIEKHIQLSLERTGKEHRQIHEWMDGNNLSPKERLERHRTANIPKFLPIVENKFGKPSAKEYLQHIEDDNNNNPLLKPLKFLGKFLVK